jgi:signal transduction histidine kinase
MIACLLLRADASTFAAGAGFTALLAGGASLARREAGPQRREALAIAPRAGAPEPPDAELREQVAALEERVREASAELARAQAEFESFHSSVSHDLRSPLGAIVNLVAILSEDAADRLDDTGRECLRRIESSARAALSLTDGIVAFVHGGKDPLRPEPIPMRALFEEEAARLAALHAPDARVAIGDLPDADGDPDMIRAVVANLLANAFKFVRKGEGAEIEISGRDVNGEHVYAVRDRGIGIDARWADRLFKPFERLHGSPDYSGHGLGLAVVARLVRRHGGRVWAEGARDAGATFFFSLPKR